MLDINPNARRFYHELIRLAPDHPNKHRVANVAEMVLRYRQGKTDAEELRILKEELARLGLSLEDLQ